MKIKIRKNLETIALVQRTTEELVKLLSKHQKYFGADALNSYLNDFNNDKINYDELCNNVYKDIIDYESCL